MPYMLEMTADWLDQTTSRLERVRSYPISQWESIDDSQFYAWVTYREVRGLSL